jgi:hypothetical protein
MEGSGAEPSNAYASTPYLTAFYYDPSIFAYRSGQIRVWPSSCITRFSKSLLREEVGFLGWKFRPSQGLHHHRERINGNFMTLAGFEPAVSAFVS